MARERFVRVLPLLLLAALFSAGSWAATPIPRTLQDLSAEAEVVVVGTVAEQQARFNDDQTLILTDTTIRVEETLAGETGGWVTVSEYGGIVGDKGLVVSGLPRFREGDRVLLFLCRDFLGLLRTCGASQGKLELRTTSDGVVRASGLMAGRRIDATLQELRATIPAARTGGEQ